MSCVNSLFYVVVEDEYAKETQKQTLEFMFCDAVNHKHYSFALPQSPQQATRGPVLSGADLAMKPTPPLLKVGDVVEPGIDGLGSERQIVTAFGV